MMTGRWVLSAAVCLLAAAAPAAAGSFDHSHRLFARVLERFTEDGVVDYGALKQEPGDLRRYLDGLAQVSQAQFQTWTPSEQLAFLINLYNAQTLDLILRHYPVASMKAIGNLFRGPWDQKVVRLWGRETTLNHLEHEILRKEYDEPRIHFALVCAARGCPPLRDEAYTAKRLNAQLDDNGRAFFAQTRKNYVDLKTKTLYLSPVFKWFKEDFTKKTGSLTGFVRPYFSREKGKALAGGKFRIRFTAYDWSLNDRKSGEDG